MGASVSQLLCAAEINKCFLYIALRLKYLKSQIEGDACFVGVKCKSSSESDHCLPWSPQFRHSDRHMVPPGSSIWAQACQFPEAFGSLLVLFCGPVGEPFRVQ